MKGALTLLLCFWLMVCCTTTAWAQLPEEVEEALPEAAEELLEDLGETEADTGTLQRGLRRMGEMAWDVLSRDFRASLRVAILLLSVVLLHGMTESIFMPAMEEYPEAAMV